MNRFDLRTGTGFNFSLYIRAKAQPDYEGEMTHLELYKQQIKKLYPDIEDEEFNKMVEEFETDMVKQWDSIKEQWVKVVANISAV